LNCFQGVHCVFGFLQVNFCDQPWFGVMGALEDEISFFALKRTLQRTSWKQGKPKIPKRPRTCSLPQLYVNVRTCELYHFLNELGASLEPAVAS
jgi:hypothetical protein